MLRPIKRAKKSTAMAPCTLATLASSRMVLWYLRSSPNGAGMIAAHLERVIAEFVTVCKYQKDIQIAHNAYRSIKTNNEYEFIDTEF